MNTYYTGKFINVGFWKQMKDLLPQLLLSLLMLGCCLVTSYLIPNALIGLISSCLVGVAVYLGGSHLLKLYGYAEFCKIIRSKIHK